MDELDLKILEFLQRDARLPFTQIAKELGQPDTTVHFRTRRLLKTGVVTRFSALVNPSAFGFESSALLRIQIGGHILPEISVDRTRSFAYELGDDEHFLWIAIGGEPMTIHALLMAKNDDEISQIVEELKKRPDVVGVSVTTIEQVTKGWEITGIHPQEGDEG